MANFMIQIRWSATAPSRKEMARINVLLERLDGDCPPIDETGMFESWRMPMLELEELLSVLHAYGYCCHGRWTECDWLDEDWPDVVLRLEALPWQQSSPELGWALGKELKAGTLRAFSRRFGRWLRP